MSPQRDLVSESTGPVSATRMNLRHSKVNSNNGPVCVKLLPSTSSPYLDHRVVVELLFVATHHWPAVHDDRPLPLVGDEKVSTVSVGQAQVSQ